MNNSVQDHLNTSRFEYLSERQRNYITLLSEVFFMKNARGTVLQIVWLLFKIFLTDYGKKLGV